MYERFAALRVRPAGREVRKAVDGPEPPACWLLADRPAQEPDTALTTLVGLANLRWRIEHDDREMKQALKPPVWSQGTIRLVVVRGSRVWLMKKCRSMALGAWPPGSLGRSDC